ncbi:MAG: 6-pyruvoyl tetrahydrobiopterin synthase [Corynebacterium sp.]|nr:6-pyruvoyl tetrahydrobiopterin synthase [Corynebacterium sp.]
MEYNAAINPYIGAPGMATMHGDAQSSDTTPLPGPGANPWSVTSLNMGGACPTILVGQDGLVQVLVTQRFGSTGVFLQPKLVILDPDANVLGELELPKGALLGGVYAFLDQDDSMVLVDGSNTLLRIAHDPQPYVAQRTNLRGFLAAHGGDQVVGLVPDWQGRVWVASAKGGVAVIDQAAGTVRATSLGAGETVDNSISSAPEGVAIATSHALYLLDADADGNPQIQWRSAYDRGTFRKPGQLSWGTGATPSFFGPNGSEYISITDNADVQESILVFDTATGRLVSDTGIFQPGKSGSECSMISIGNTVIASSSYGYPYPRVPEGQPASKPLTAQFAPGFERWDLKGGSLQQVWNRKDVYCAVVPRYSTADGLIYICERKPFGIVTGPTISAAAIDMETGKTVYSQRLPGLVTVFGVDTLQMVGTLDNNGTWWQGTIGGLFRIAAK